MDEDLTGLEQHEGEQLVDINNINDKFFTFFEWTITIYGGLMVN